MKAKKISVMIIEDNKLLREGIRAMLNEHKDINVIAALGDRIRVLDKIKTLNPDVLLLDLGLVNQNSLDLVKSIKKKYPGLAIIAMDLLPVQSEIIQFAEAGVCGFILKNTSTEDLVKTIRDCEQGKKVFPSQMHGSLFSKIVDTAVNELLDSKLVESLRMTEAERKVIELISAGYTDKEIAKKLHITSSIVKGYIGNILEKMSLNTHVQIAIYRNSGEDILGDKIFYPALSDAKIEKSHRKKQITKKPMKGVRPKK